jgi:PleD family two-component response regulator
MALLLLADRTRQQAELSATRFILLTSGGRPGELTRVSAARDHRHPAQAPPTFLSRLGLSAAMAVDGREALALLEREPFDLLLLDIHMPELERSRPRPGEPGTR